MESVLAPAFSSTATVFKCPKEHEIVIGVSCHCIEVKLNYELE